MGNIRNRTETTLVFKETVAGIVLIRTTSTKEYTNGDLLEWLGLELDGWNGMESNGWRVTISQE